MKRSKVRVAAGTVLASGAVWLAVSTPAFPSVFVSSASPPASLNLVTDATLQAKGVRIAVSVTFQCPADASEAYMNVFVSQRAGSVINSGSWYDDVECTGGVATATAYVNATTKPFKKGTAAATAELTAYRWGSPGWAIELQDDQVIRIK